MSRRGHRLQLVRLYADESLPEWEEVDWALVLGGPMGVGDEEQYPWLRQEKAWLGEGVERGKLIWGICLGAQLLAEILGAKVYPNPHKEIGWFEIQLAPEFRATPLGSAMPDTLLAFHWHGDTFPLPSGALPVARSEATAVQGFWWDQRILGLQFHLETTPEIAKELITHDLLQYQNEPFVQSAGEMLEDSERFKYLRFYLKLLIESQEQIL